MPSSPALVLRVEHLRHRVVVGINLRAELGHLARIHGKPGLAEVDLVIQRRAGLRDVGDVARVVHLGLQVLDHVDDVTLLVENEFDCNVATGSETARLFRAISDRRLMHNWDPGNCFMAGEQPYPKAWNQLDHSRIGHMHLKDAEGKKWMPIGKGKIDFVGQFRALKKIGYSHTMSLETHYRNAQRDPYTSSEESMDGLVAVLKKV